MRKLSSIILVVLIIFMTGCTTAVSSTIDTTQEQKVDPPKVQIEKKEITLLAAGDIMFHQPQLKAAFNGKAYDFKPQLEGVKEEVEAADIAVANFETTINPEKKASGYPMFNSPIEALDAVKYAGFDVLTTANNHCMDSGSKGLLNTVESIRQRNMVPIGTGKPEEDKFAVVEKNGIKVGMLSYTFGTNGIKAPDGMVNTINLDKIKSDIEKIRPQADFVIVFLHYGTEYIRKVEPGQAELFRKIADFGADSVIGGHPHVARESEIYETNGKRVFIAYSMGNFLSNQNDKYTDIGLMLKLKIVKEETTKLGDVEIMPVYRLRYKEGTKTVYDVVPLDKIDKYARITKEQKSYVSSVFNELSLKEDVAVFNNK